MGDDWEIPESNPKVGCCLIPGNEEGPFEQSRNFLLNKIDNLNSLWILCDDELKKEMKRWYPKESYKEPKKVYFISSIAMENSTSDNWEVAFGYQL